MAVVFMTQVHGVKVMRDRIVMRLYLAKQDRGSASEPEIPV